MIQDSASAATTMNFTLQHRVRFENYTPDKIGLIVKAKGVYYNLDKSTRPSISESLPEVDLCTTARCKAVFGVISDVEDTGKRRHSVGAFVSLYAKDDGIERIFVNSGGEGALWTCSANGNLKNGDFVTSSEVPGYGMRQDDDILHNYTVAKVTQDGDFSSPPSWMATRVVDDGYICAFVGCTYCA